MTHTVKVGVTDSFPHTFKEAINKKCTYTVAATDNFTHTNKVAVTVKFYSYRLNDSHLLTHTFKVPVIVIFTHIVKAAVTNNFAQTAKVV